MKIVRRLWPAMVLVLGVLLTTGSRADAASPAGNWDALVVEQCDASVVGAQLCGALLPSTAVRAVAAFHATCDATGTCTFTEAVTYLAGSTGLSTCTLPISTAFSGQCTYVWTGTAVIKSNKVGLPTFQVTSETGTVFPSPLLGVPSLSLTGGGVTYPYDLGIPAVPGTYTNTTQNLRLLGYLPAGTTAPPGLTAIATISQTAAGAPPVALSLPLPTTSVNGGTSGAFVVSWFNQSAGTGLVNFGASCSGLVGTSLSDLVPGGQIHLVIVSGNELPGAAGDIGILPGAAYDFQVATTTSSGTTVDNNGGQCYSVTLPM